MTSLRRRALAGAVVWTGLVFVIGVTAIIALFDRIAVARFNDVLEERLVQVAVALSYRPASEEALSRTLVDPAYQRPYSGRYWQVRNDETEMSYVSPSLFDTLLAPPFPATDRPVPWEGPGPQGDVRGLSQNVILEDGSVWTVTVAESVGSLTEQRRLVMSGATAVFLLLGVLAATGAAALTSAILRPIEKLSSDVENRWAAGMKLAPEAYPQEIVPLVNDVNLLVERNQDIVARARRRAADLAHALKTPAAALRNELSGYAEAGTDVVCATDALDRIDAQLKRALIRMRAEYASSDVNNVASIPKSIRRLERLFTSSAGRGDIEFGWSADEDLTIPVNPQDFEEALGNLMDNAFKWAASRVRVMAGIEGDTVWVQVEDDGPGVDDEKLQAILEPAYRIDTSRSGSGLGLAITNDLVSAYGGSVDTSRSGTLGGLCVRMRFQARSPGLGHLA